MRNKTINRWLKAAKEMQTGGEPVCPSCAASNLTLHYVRYQSTNHGWAYFYCGTCLKGIHLSRVIVPPDTPFGYGSKIPEIELIN